MAMINCPECGKEVSNNLQAVSDVTGKEQVFGNCVVVDCLVYVEQEKQKQLIIGFVEIAETNLKCNG
mgnify:CR=1 FL=1